MFFNYDKRTIYIILAVLVLIGLMSFGVGDILSLVLTLPGVIIAITFHEYAHAFVADKLGDDTPRNQGRLTLNPLKHIDPVGFILLIFANFGWGKPVEINPRNFRRDISMSKGEALVSIAGPAMNFILAIVFTIIYFLVYKFGGVAFITSKLGIYILIAIQYTAILNIGLGVFNLLPFPPLDGSKIFKNFMSYNVRNWIEEHEMIFYYIFLAIWITGLASVIISPVINWIYSGIFNGISFIFSLF
jgi:Zn-dependent protease